MSGLTDTQQALYIKPGAAELASIFADVLDAVKNAPPAYKQMVEEHKALKQTRAEHQRILDNNAKVLSDHETSRNAWIKEQIKDKAEREKYAKEISEREANLTKRETSVNVQDAALSRKDKEQKDTALVFEKRKADLDAREANLILRENSVKLREDKVFEGENSLRTKQEKIKAVIG